MTVSLVKGTTVRTVHYHTGHNVSGNLPDDMDFLPSFDNSDDAVTSLVDDLRNANCTCYDDVDPDADGESCEHDTTAGVFLDLRATGDLYEVLRLHNEYSVICEADNEYYWVSRCDREECAPEDDGD